MTHTQTQWYAKNAGNDYQGLVIDEATGRTVAVAYDRNDTAMLAAAPAMYEASKRLLIAIQGETHPDWYEGMQGDAIDELEQALRLAEGGKP